MLFCWTSVCLSLSLLCLSQRMRTSTAVSSPTALLILLPLRWRLSFRNDTGTVVWQMAMMIRGIFSCWQQGSETGYWQLQPQPIMASLNKTNKIKLCDWSIQLLDFSVHSLSTPFCSTNSNAPLLSLFFSDSGRSHHKHRLDVVVSHYYYSWIGKMDERKPVHSMNLKALYILYGVCFEVAI